ncbi:hypothetical protein ACFLXE_00070 [Chloroflexota bacterium]
MANQAISTANLTKVLDMLNYLKGKSGAIEIESDVRIGTVKSIRLRKSGSMIDIDIIGDGVDTPDLYFNFGKDVGSLANKFRINELGVVTVGSLTLARISDFAAGHSNLGNGVHGVAGGDSIEVTSHKNQVNGYCGLNASAKVNDAQIPVANCVRVGCGGIIYVSATWACVGFSYTYADLQGNSLRFCCRHTSTGNHGVRFRNVTDNIVLAEHWHTTTHATPEWTDIWFTAPSGVKEFAVEVKGSGSLGIGFQVANLRGG